MKRLLGLLALVLVPSLLVIPTAPAHAAVGPKDLQARTAKVLKLAAQDKWAEVAKYADADSVAWLKSQRRPLIAKECKRSVLSKPGRTVYACRVAERASTPVTGEELAQFWVFYRQIDSHWTLVNRRLITSAAQYRVRSNIEARADKVWALIVAKDWEGLGPYATPAGLNQIRSYIEAEGPANPRTDPIACDRVIASKRSRYGDYLCQAYYFAFDALNALSFSNVDGQWLTTGLKGLPDEEV